MSIPDETLARWAAWPRPGTPGPWMHNPYRTDVVWVNRGVAEFVCDCSGSDHDGKDSEAIAALPEMREAIDALVGEVRRLRDELNRAHMYGFEMEAKRDEAESEAWRLRGDA